MILVDDEKYACVQCIRGHRSSTCKHSARPLVQVRSRGRPSLTATHRIAVTETEIVLSREEVTFQDPKDNKAKKESAPKLTAESSNPIQEPEAPKRSCCGGCPPTAKPTVVLPKRRSCCSNAKGVCACNNKSGVILLKAAKRQFVDVKGGNLDFVGPYNGSAINSFKVESPNLKKPKHTAAHINQLKLLKTIKLNEVNYNFNANGFNVSQLENSFYHTPSSSSASSSIQFSNNQNFSTQDNNLERTLQHFQNVSLQHQVYSQFNQQYTQNTSQHIQSPSLSNSSSNPNTQLFDMMLSSGCAAECNCGPDCSCPGCLIHRTNEELKDYGILDNSSTTVSTPDIRNEMNSSQQDLTVNGNGANPLISQQEDHDQSQVDLINFETIDELLLQEMLEDSCICEPDECRCYNCLEHGISEGIRLKDGVKVSNLIDALSLSAIMGDHADDGTIEEYEHDCGCLPEECECYNCAKHGICNGVKVKQELYKGETAIQASNL